jgi:heptosyltransferase-1
MKILIVKTSSMGDVIHALPAITDLARAIPDLTIDWVVEETFQEIPYWHAAVRHVFPCALRRWRKRPFKASRSKEWKNFCIALQKEKYDFVIDLQGLVKSAFITRLAYGMRCGFDFSTVREKLASFAYDELFVVSKNQHAIARNRQLLANVVGYEYDRNQLDYGIVTNNVRPAHLPRNYVMLIVNTSMKNKYWSLQGWKAVLEKTAEKNIPVVIPAGYAEEKKYVDSIVAGFSHVTVLPLSSLTATKTVVRHADVVVSVDTGLSHLSAALNRPTIVLYTATDPKKVGTRGLYQHHLQSIDGRAIEVEEVWKLMLRHF